MKAFLFGFIITLISVCFAPSATAQNGAGLGESERVSLWPEGTAGVDRSIAEKVKTTSPKRIFNIHNPNLSIFRPENPNGAAVVICPGGGYRILSIDNEGTDIAKRLNREGITAFVLRYRLPTTRGVDFKHPVPLSDALRAIQWVRFHSNDYNIDANKVGIMGFSAGGHLAASAATLYADYSFGEDAVSTVSSRPDFVCLGYPVISTKKKIAHGCINSLKKNSLPPSQVWKLSCEVNVDANTPPTFLFHAKDDPGVKYQNSVVMHEALQRVGVPTELKLYEQGKHGFGLGVPGTDSIHWPEDFLSWMEAQGYIPESSAFYTPEEDLQGLEVRSETVSGLPNVLIIGDSISVGYTQVVVDALQGVANVTRIRENAGDTNRGLVKLDRWLGDTEWDVIHFNWGLHDLCYRHPDAKVYGNRDKVNGTQAVPLAEYTKNLEQLVIRLKQTGAQLVWASTTLVPEEEAGRFVGDEVRYNEAAAEIMLHHGIPIDDLHAVSLTLTRHFKRPGDVHFSKEGYQALGEQVAASIEPFLK
ncbi:alpha/beta hydrolase fold domain-containing protein [Coraliomargarita algicola]|uniref:Alpha/beta hydrolase fold domain-containing protein n=1 Tax=Coraliomargarita algicola TaxID=3092156 RepID=A0ABZ0RIH2_9BACT|nr:alpha/beta hydrolase fold domain-containing protein [Coraliomargarita sp. J2-16]WPJ95999.1 alpha/beta hydrolase fold domain-containing protein [Coraliomargarita sp. J2-16]